MTPLAHTVENGHIETAKLLIRLGARSDIELDGKDLLTFAVELKQLDIIRFV